MMAKGFEGDLVFVLQSPRSSAGEPRSDTWTISIGGERASARPGRSPRPAVVLEAELPTFVRMAAGEQWAGSAITDGTIHIEGDVLLAVRIAELFGFVPPLDLA